VCITDGNFVGLVSPMSFGAAAWGGVGDEAS